MEEVTIEQETQFETDKTVIRHTAKDSVFTNLFKNKKYLFALYQALHPEDKDACMDDLETVTLNTVITKDIYNDLGFTVGERLVILVEAQSTWSVNIALRCMAYMAKTYQNYLSETKQSLYAEKAVKIPAPELYVVYTGEKKIPKKVISLSEEFFGGAETAIDVRVKVITDNGGNDILSQYIVFCKVLNEQIAKYGRTAKAFNETIRICKNKNVLKEFLIAHEKEVIDVMVQLYSQSEVVDDLMESERREGREEGRKEGQEELKSAIDRTIAKMLVYRFGSHAEIADTTNSTIDHVREIEANLIKSGQLPATNT